jgi:hypothetical protein
VANKRATGPLRKTPDKRAPRAGRLPGHVGKESHIGEESHAGKKKLGSIRRMVVAGRAVTGRMVVLR